MFNLRRALIVFTVALLSVVMAGDAFANLLITPQRIVFEGRDRSATVLLMNSDSKPHAYRISWELKKAGETGQYVNIPLEPDNAYSVPNMIVHSPRQVRIGPNGRQNVRLSLRRPADLPPGEYRGHLLFEALPDEAKRTKLAGQGGMSVEILMNLAFSVPVIVRTSGTGTTDVSLGEFSFQPRGRGQVLRLAVNRLSGTDSVYGRFLVFLEGAGRAGKQIGLLNNVPLYPEQDKRIVNVPLRAEIPPNSKLRVVYQGTAEYKGRTLAEKIVAITQ